MIKLIIFFNVFFLSIVAYFSNPKPETTLSDMPMCSNMQEIGINPLTGNNAFPILKSVKAAPSVFETLEDKAYAMPLLTQSPKGDVLMSWMEKDDQGVTSFCFSLSTDKGKTFSDNKTIFKGAGISSSRLFRAKLLAKKDGSLVAVFTNRPDAQPQAKGGRGGRGGELVFSISKDNGSTWTTPKAVDTDTTKGLMRGFFDAVVLPNDEVAVTYLKDVKGSTKHEERDLRISITKNGVFQAEKLLDAVVCDCCNINMLVDAKGALNVIYRDNNDDIRDFSKMVSTDNGETFSKPQNVYNDGWKIAGCPHSGAISATNGKSALIAYYSGAESETGFKLVTQEGKKLLFLDDPSVKNPSLMTSSNVSAMLWEQGKGSTQLVFRKINNDKISEPVSVEGSANATNATGLIIDNQLIMAHEVKQENKKNTLKVSTMTL